MKIRALMACAICVLLAGCATAGLADSKGAEGEGALGGLQALAERLLAENPMILLSREMQPLQLPADEIAALLAALKPETWEPMESAYSGIPDVSGIGFSIFSKEGGAPTEIRVNYDQSFATVTLYGSTAGKNDRISEYMANEDVREYRKYAIPKDTLLGLKSFGDRVKVAYPYPRVMNLGNLQAIVDEMIRDGEAWINTSGPGVHIIEASASDLMAALRLGDWIPKGGVKDISGMGNPANGSDLAITRSFFESDFDIYFYAETNTAMVAHIVYDLSVTWMGGPEIYEGQDYSLPPGTVDRMFDFLKALQAAEEAAS
jgi:hypothetical protein